ncbi:hypothetical protein COI_2050 [Mannheimia haemolytica serotype A2 str. OVINE]|nr:hypothetical protein COI_2050 [Mannheimia haemolytica serotype A2 str. OVINE]EEY13380.1 hypothetical protein COK_0521 [Mannheimia haemolytica serotype A2 str. BOVINE]
MTDATFVPFSTLVCTAFNWRRFTASVSFWPSATLVITLLPALIPIVVTLGPPLLIVKPF